MTGVDAMKVLKGWQQRAEENPDPITGQDFVVQIDLAGEEGGDYYVTVAGGRMDVGQGRRADASLTLAMSAADFAAMGEGRLSASQAYMSGRLKIKGDLGLAMKLQGLLR